MDITNRISTTDPPWPTRSRRRTSLLRASPLAGAILAAALIAGCAGSSSGGGVAHVNTSTTAKSSSTSSTTPNRLAFAQCMRSHGVPTFPDPTSSGGLQLPSGMTTSSPAFQSAAKHCGSLIGGETAPKAINSPQAQAAALRVAKCMRANGVPNFPDGPITQSSGIDENSPAFKSAFQKCNKHLSGSSQVPVTGG